MDIEHLSRFGSLVRDRATAAWTQVVAQSQPWLQWLRLRPQVHPMLFPVGMGIVIILLLVTIWHWYSFEQPDHNGVIHHPHADILNPIAAALGGAVLAWAALRQARTATKQAEIASERHKAQTDADREQRLTESYSKAVEQLVSEKIEERLGGIYTLEQISQESPSRYWTVMETLTAFVRERSQRNEAERISQDTEPQIARRAYLLWKEAGQPDGRAEDFWAAAVNREAKGDPPATDIAAVLMVIKRRRERNREREGISDWHFDLSQAVLKYVNLVDAHLEGANLVFAHLEGANLAHAHLKGADLGGAHLKGASLTGADLAGASLAGAHFERASLLGAHLEGANLAHAHLEGAILWEAHLEGAYLGGAHSDAATILPKGVERLPHWPPERQRPTDAA